MNLKDISKNETLLVKIMKGNNPDVIVKIFRDEDNDNKYIYTNENGKIMFSGSTSYGPVDNYILIEAFKQVVDGDISQFKFMTSNSALYLTGKLN